MKATWGFDRLKNGLERLVESARQAIVNVQSEALNDAVSWVTNQIETQSFEHTPLAESTVLAKQRTGLDPRILIATRDYLSSFGVYQAETDKSIKYAGVPKRLFALQNYLEYGTSGVRSMPARPHWGPARRRLYMKLPSYITKAGFKSRRSS